MTPEGKVKAKIKKVIDKYNSRIYIYMPVPNGYGAPTLDYIGIFHGIGFAIEAKRARKDLTERQKGTRDDIEAAGGIVFRVRDDEELAVFAAWVEKVDQDHGGH